MKVNVKEIEDKLGSQLWIGHKRGYHTYSDVVFGWVAWICLSISDFFAEYLDFFTMDGTIEKSHGGAPPGPRGSARAGVRREAPHSGRSGAPRARRCTSVWFFNFTIHREKVKILSKKVWDTQANPSYSAKNNVAIRVIATFMPNTNLRP